MDKYYILNLYKEYIRKSATDIMINMSLDMSLEEDMAEEVLQELYKEIASEMLLLSRISTLAGLFDAINSNLFRNSRIHGDLIAEMVLSVTNKLVSDVTK